MNHFTLIVACAFLACISSAITEVIQIREGESGKVVDTLIAGSQPTDSFQSSATIAWGEDKTEPLMLLIKFSIFKSDDGGIIEKGVNVMSAILGLRTAMDDTGPPGNIHQINIDWDPTTTYAAFNPVLGSTHATISLGTLSQPDAGGWYLIDVTASVQDWTKGKSENNGWLVTQTPGTVLSGTTTIESSQATAVMDRPFLKITYEVTEEPTAAPTASPTVAPTSTASPTSTPTASPTTAPVAQALTFAPQRITKSPLPLLTIAPSEVPTQAVDSPTSSATLAPAIQWETAPPSIFQTLQPGSVIPVDDGVVVECDTYESSYFKTVYTPPISAYKQACIGCIITKTDTKADPTSKSDDTAAQGLERTEYELRDKLVTFGNEKFEVETFLPEDTNPKLSLMFCAPLPKLDLDTSTDFFVKMTFTIDPINRGQKIGYKITAPEKLDCDTVGCENGSLVFENNVVVEENNIVVISDPATINGDVVGGGSLTLSTPSLIIKGCLNITGVIVVALDNNRTVEDSEQIASIETTCLPESELSFSVSGGTTARPCESLGAAVQRTQTGLIVSATINDQACRSSSSSSSTVVIAIAIVTPLVVLTAVGIAVYYFVKKKIHKKKMSRQMDRLESNLAATM